MRTVAMILSLLGFYALLRLVNVEVVHFMPAMVSGPEGGLIEAAAAGMVGPVLAIIALLLAAYRLQRSRKDRQARILFLWCCLLLIGFVALFIKARFGDPANRPDDNPKLQLFQPR